MVSSYRSLSSWWYLDFLDHSVQDVPPPSLSRTWIFHRSPCWRRSQAYRLPAHDQVLSYVRVDILEMANIVLGYPHVVVSQSCANGILCRFRHTSFPVLEFAFTSLSATLENSMLCSHSSLWLQVSLYYLRSKFEFFCFQCPWAARCTRTQRCLETDRQSSTLNSTWVLISQPFVHLLLVFLAAFAFSTRSERSWSSWNGLMQTVKFPWCWTNGEGGSTLHGWNCPFCQDVGKLVLGVNKFDLDLGSKLIVSNCPIERDSVGTGHMSHDRTSALYNHLSWLLLRCHQQCKAKRRSEKVCVCNNMIDIDQFEIISVEVFLRSGVGAFSWLLIVAQVSLKTKLVQRRV